MIQSAINATESQECVESLFLLTGSLSVDVRFGHS
jgi:hypothetical protein